jgi:type IV pilus assembly protein PilN
VIKRELRELNKKLEVIQTLDLNREGPVRLLDAMTGIIVPKRMWFTSLEEKKAKATEEITKSIITIKGTALDNKTVADFMTRLEGSKFFTNVELMTLKQEKNNQNLKSFQVKCEKAQIKNNPVKADKK